MDGYLEKMGDVIRNWKRRYFLFSPDRSEIFYFESMEKSMLPNGQVHVGAALGSISLLSAIVTSFDDLEHNKANCFGIQPVSGNRVYLLCAETAELKSKWLSVIAPKASFEKVAPVVYAPVLAGWLVKQGAVMKSWKRRFFELYAAGELLYFVDENKCDLLGTISLVGATLQPILTGFEQSFCFGVMVQDGNRNFVLAAETEVWREQWVRAIGEIVANLRDAIGSGQVVTGLHSSHSNSVAVMVSAAPTNGITTVVKSGWLLKLGEHVKNWKKRWFVLTGPMLFYYEAPENNQIKPKGKVNMLGGKVEFGPKIDELYEKQFAFGFTCANSSRRYVFVCESASELDDWVTTISSCVTAKGAGKLQKQGSVTFAEESFIEEEEELPEVGRKGSATEVRQAITMGSTAILSNSNLVGNLATKIQKDDSSTIWDQAKATVSKQKRRFVADGFNLDLTYITDRIIAMGFPAESYEGLYRNSMEEVQRFFETRHREHYKVYNLCSERIYEASKFQGRVMHFPFDDHNCPNFNDMEYFCQDVGAFLTADPANIVAIHCKAGKGRTGLMIAVFMLYAGVWENPEQALSYYAFARTKNMKGVTIASQIRWVYYFDKYLRLRDFGIGLPPPHAKKLIRIVVGANAPLFDAITVTNNGVKYTSSHNFPKFWKRDAADGTIDVLCGDNIVLTKDFCITFIQYKFFGASKSVVFGAWLNTQFVRGTQVLKRKELDKVCKRKDIQDFKIELFLESTNPAADAEYDERAANMENMRTVSGTLHSSKQSIDIGRFDAAHNGRELAKTLEEYRSMADDDSEDEDDGATRTLISGPTSPATNKKSLHSPSSNKAALSQTPPVVPLPPPPPSFPEDFLSDDTLPPPPSADKLSPSSSNSLPPLPTSDALPSTSFAVHPPVAEKKNRWNFFS